MRIKTFTWDQILKLNKSKQEMVKLSGLVENGQFDYALPQNWLNNFVKRNNLEYDKVRFSTVWYYQDDPRIDYPVSFCQEIQLIIDKETIEYES